MSISLQVLYPITETTNFDYDYYFSKHMKLVKDTFGDHLDDTLVTKASLVDLIKLLHTMLLQR